MSLIEAYVAELGGALRGRRSVKADMLAEARDGLHDASAALRACGWDSAGAERQAIADFGTVAQVAPDYQVQLGLSQGRRTAILLCLALAAQPVLWRVLLPLAGWPSGADSSAYAVVNRLVQVTGALSIATGLALAVAMGVGTRWRVVGGGLARVTGVFAFAVCAVIGVLGTLMTVFGAGPLLAWHGLPAALVLLGLPLFAVGREARACLTAAPR